MDRDEKLRSFVPKRARVVVPSREDSRISVVSWLVDVGHAVVRKFRGVRASPLVRIHD